MRKLILLFLFSLTILHSSNAQVDTIFTERFDQPSGADSVLTGSFVGTQPPTSAHGFTISNLYTSPAQSFRGKGQIATGTRFHYVDTKPFSTNKYVFLYFNHICKINNLNKARIKVSIDSGQTFTLVRGPNYRGSSINFPITHYFNDYSYRTAIGGDPWAAGSHTSSFTPNNSWWRSESFDLSGIASDTANDVGYNNVVIRFEFELQYDLSQLNTGGDDTYPAGSTGYGWLLDDIIVTTAGCELEPPVLDWDLQPVPCFFNNPEGGIVHEPDETYRVALSAIDRPSGINEVRVYYKIHRADGTKTALNDIVLRPDSGGNQVGAIKVTRSTDVYYGDLTGIGENDTVYYYVKALDNSCPNESKSPELTEFYKFWTISALPEMCGQPNCNIYPELIEVTEVIPDADGTLWNENFEASRWRAGNNGVSNEQNGHRGDLPDFPDGAWFVNPSLNPNNNTKYAWNVGTSSLPKAHGQTTGPAGNHTPGGNKYMFADYSLGTVPSDIPSIITFFQTPCIDLTKETRCLAFEFYYHMFGAALDANGDPNAASVLRADIIYSDNPMDENNTAKKIIGQTQISSTDDWKKMIFSLGPYLGQYVQIRFMAVKKINIPNVPAGIVNQGDIAVDDLRIFEPDDKDFEVLEVLSPRNGFCYYSDEEPVTMVIRNNGCQTQTDIPVSFRVSGGAPVYDTIRTNLALGDTLTYTFSEGADLSAFNPSHSVTVSTHLPGDIRTGNDSQSSEDIEHIDAIRNFPFIEDFEDGTSNTQTLGNNLFRFMPGLSNAFEWRVGENMTPVRYSGPFSGFYFGGKYLYTHTAQSPAANTGLETYFRSICFDLGSLSSPVIGFYYHLYGSRAMQDFYLEVSRENEDLSTWDTISDSHIITTGQQSKELDDWKFMKVDLSDYAGQSIKIRFKAVRTEVEGEDGVVDPTTYRSNFAIDNIMVYDEAANDAGVIAISEPVTYAEAGTTSNPKVKITNYGSSSLSSVPVTIAITPLCGPNGGQTSTYSGSVSLTTALGSGATSDPTEVSGANITWPEGEFEICAYTALSGDNSYFNDTVCRHLTAYGQHDIGWGSNFDTCDYSFDGFYLGDNYSASGNILRSYRQWELGEPDGNRISTSHSGNNAWVTNLDGSVLDSSDEFLYIPLLENFDTIVKAEIQFYQNLDMPTANPRKNTPAAGAVEYQVNNQWKSIGSDFIQDEIGTNWYYGPFGALSLDIFNGNPGFAGQSNGNWIYTVYPMAELNYDTTVQNFRFRFKAGTLQGGGAGTEGWGIDNFRVYIPPQNSAAPTRVRSSDNLIFPGVEQTLTVTVENTGAKNLENYDLKVRIDDGNGNFTDLGTMPIVPNPVLTTNNKHRVQYTYPWEAQDVTVGLHQVQVITSRPNEKQDNKTDDDTLYWSFTVLDTIDFRQNTGDTLYCNDFESKNGVAPWFATNSDVYQEGNFSWEWGEPLQFGLAHSGVSSWVTGMSVDYPQRDSSALITPIFLVDSGQTLEMEFYYWIKSERFHDGGNVDVSFDGGNTWQTVGYALVDQDPRHEDWYNTEAVTSLDIIRPGWTGYTEDWKKARWKFAFEHNVQAIFRFRFASDYDLEDNGWAIDDFCLRHSEKPYQRIGTEENELPKEKIASQLSPNPSMDGHSQLALYLSTPKEGQVVVINSVGQMMESRDIKLNEGVNTIPFNGSRWESGMYIIKLYLGDSIITRKLIIAK